MPMIDLTIPEGSISEPELATLTDELATVLLKAERAPDTDFFREITWVYVHQVPAGALAVGGRAGGVSRFRVQVTVPEGALSDRRKAELVDAVHGAVSRAAGLDPAGERALHVWTIVDEVPDGNWGAGGQVVHFDQLREISAAERAGATTGASA